MLRSLAICVSEEIFISFNCAISMVGAPSGRSGATNFFTLIGGFFSLWDLGSVNCSLNSSQDFVLSKRCDCRESSYLLCVKFMGARLECLFQLITGNLIGFS